jgi:hypothetical protein
MTSDRKEELLGKLLDGSLSGDEREELMDAAAGNRELAEQLFELLSLEPFVADLLRNDDDGTGFLRQLRHRLDSSSDTGFIRRVVETARKDAISEASAQGVDGDGPAMPSTRRSRSRRIIGRDLSRIPSQWIALAAAGLLIGVLVFITVEPSDTGSGRGKTAHRKRESDRSSRDSKAVTEDQAAAPRDERDRELASADADKKRHDAEAQLREIEGKRRILTQAKPESVEGPEAKEKREKDLADLKREKERIEQALREAADLAKNNDRPAPAGPSQEQNPSSPQATPGVKPEGATQAAIAQVEEVSGDAFLVTKEGKTPLAPGGNVFAVQGLQTGGAASRILLRFPDKTQVELGPQTMLAELKTDSGKRLSLTQGTLRAVVAKQPKDQPMVITTPQGQAKVIGTTLRLVVDPDPRKGTRLDVEEGNVELKNLSGRTVLVESGHFAVTASDTELVSMPALLFSDSFDRGNLSLWRIPLGSDWHVTKNPSGPGFTLTGGPGASADRWGWRPLLCGNPSWQDYAVEASARFESPVRGARLIARVQDIDNFYWFEYANSPEGSHPLVYLFRHAKRENFLIKSEEAAGLEPNRWIRFRFELIRKTLKGSEDGFFASGAAGLTPRWTEDAGWGSPVQWKDVRVENLSTPKTK